MRSGGAALAHSTTQRSPTNSAARALAFELLQRKQGVALDGRRVCQASLLLVRNSDAKPVSVTFGSQLRGHRNSLCTE